MSGHHPWPPPSKGDSAATAPSQPLGLARKRARIITLARQWAEKGGLGWSDDEWERELARLREAVREYDEALSQ